MASERLILEIEVPGFNVEGIRECVEGEYGGDITVLDYLLDGDLLVPGCGVVVHVPAGGHPISAQEGHIVGARLTQQQSSPQSVEDPTQPQLSDEDRERLEHLANGFVYRASLAKTEGERRERQAAAAFLRKLASAPHPVAGREIELAPGCAVPVVRGDVGKDRTDFELECGHLVGLALADVASFNGRGELELPTALACPTCIASRQSDPSPHKDGESEG